MAAKKVVLKSFGRGTVYEYRNVRFGVAKVRDAWMMHCVYGTVIVRMLIGMAL